MRTHLERSFWIMDCFLDILGHNILSTRLKEHGVRLHAFGFLCRCSSIQLNATESYCQWRICLEGAPKRVVCFTDSERILVLILSAVPSPKRLSEQQLQEMILLRDSYPL